MRRIARDTQDGRHRCASLSTGPDLGSRQSNCSELRDWPVEMHYMPCTTVVPLPRGNPARRNVVRRSVATQRPSQLHPDDADSISTRCSDAAPGPGRVALAPSCEIAAFQKAGAETLPAIPCIASEAADVLLRLLKRTSTMLAEALASCMPSRFRRRDLRFGTEKFIVDVSRLSRGIIAIHP